MTRPVSRFLLICALLSSVAATGAQTQRAEPRDPYPPPPTPVLPVLGGTPGQPLLGRLRVFEDWAVGCDNRLTCSAVSLLPAGVGETYAVLVWIERAGGPGGQANIELSGAYDLKGRIDLFIDNEAAGQLMAARDSARATGPAALTLIRRLGSSYSFNLRQGKAPVAAPSLSGLAEALRYIDETQGRIGSAAALAAIGDKPATLARPLPAGVSVPLSPDGPPPDGAVALNDEEQQAARRLAVCDGRLRNNYPIETHPLDRSHVLVLLACDAGADNVSSTVLIASGEPGARQFQIARFDLMPGFTGAPGTPPLIVNAKWNPARALLSSFSRGRPLGDCGTSESYRWDGAMFRLTEARAMPVCRGAWEWPVIWSAAAP